MVSVTDSAWSLAAQPGAGGTTDHLRRNNLAGLLTLVHREGPLSRAELTRMTGINRSTTAALVSDLVGLGLVYETMPPAGIRAGRPSPVVNASGTIAAIAVNPEVDAIHVALVALGGRVLRDVHLPVDRPLTVAEVVGLSSSLITDLLGDDDVRIAGIGVAVPGQVRLSDGVVREATHLGWAEEPMAALFESSTGYRTWAANAAVLGMRGESVFGAGKNVNDLIYFIGGASGIGGGVVTGGHWMTGAAGYAGEFGHTFVQSDGAACHCGADGCLEAEVAQAQLLEAVGLGPGELDQLAEKLRDSIDPAVRALVERDLRLLAIAVRNAVNVINPSVVVLGGFLEALYRSSDLHAPNLLSQAIRATQENVEVRAAALGAQQLFIGAAELAFTDLLADPVGFLST